MTLQGCPTCNVYTVSQPVSDKVADGCPADYRCDGCYTYETEHLA